jgi:hypothetical protein
VIDGNIHVYLIWQVENVFFKDLLTIEDRHLFVVHFLLASVCLVTILIEELLSVCREFANCIYASNKFAVRGLLEKCMFLEKP